MPPTAQPPTPGRTPATGLVLTGGGARAAYQVGVLRAIRTLRRAAGAAASGNPFPIVCGTSAGAINAAALAAGSDHFDSAVRRLTRVWHHLHADHVYHADGWSAVQAGTRWMSLLSLGWALRHWRQVRPRSLLDNAPLGELLRAQVPVQVRTEHLLASSAIPFIFPAGEVQVDGQTSWYGDGSMRQVAPISPAIHLGADRVLVIGAGRANEPPGAVRPSGAAYPSLAQVAGHALSSIFLDTLSADVERTQRINHTLSLVPPEALARSRLRPVDLLVIWPSQRLDDLAAQHVAELPPAVRALLGILGVQPGDARTGALDSYLLFEPGYIRALMQLGWDDTLRQRAEVCRFFGWADPPRLDRAGRPAPMR